MFKSRKAIKVWNTLYLNITKKRHPVEINTQVKIGFNNELCECSEF